MGHLGRREKRDSGVVKGPVQAKVPVSDLGKDPRMLPEAQTDSADFPDTSR